MGRRDSLFNIRYIFGTQLHDFSELFLGETCELSRFAYFVSDLHIDCLFLSHALHPLDLLTLLLFYVIVLLTGTRQCYYN